MKEKGFVWIWFVTVKSIVGVLADLFVEGRTPKSAAHKNKCGKTNYGCVLELP